MPRRIALLIANSEYDDPQLKRLKTPVRDAERLAQVLKDPAIGGFNVSLLINESFLTVRKAVSQLYKRRKRDDLLLLYYSGHGIKPGYNELFLAVKNTEREDVEATALDATFIRGLIDRSHSRRKIVILDSCYSGAFGEGAKSLGDSVATQDVLGGYGRVILTASNALEYAWEGDELVGDSEMSVFTRFLVEGLESGAADLDGDGEITPDELYKYVYDRMLNAGSRQTPQRWATKVEGRIIIARNPKPLVSPKVDTIPSRAESEISRYGRLAETIFVIPTDEDSFLRWLRARAAREAGIGVVPSLKAYHIPHLDPEPREGIPGTKELLIRRHIWDKQNWVILPLVGINMISLSTRQETAQCEVWVARLHQHAVQIDGKPSEFAVWDIANDEYDRLIADIKSRWPNSVVSTKDYRESEWERWEELRRHVEAQRIVSLPDSLTITTPIHMELVRVPAGEFLMGSDPAKDKHADDDEQPQHTVYLSEYYIGKYPVTNAQYAAFVKATRHKSAAWKGIPRGKEDHPVVDVSWRDAVAFCQWVSEKSGYDVKLPTEAQWEKAARGAGGRIYPWDNKWDAARANTKEGGPGDTTPVGKYSPAGDSPYGAADMSGNVWEWCADWWKEDEYKKRADKQVRDPQGPQQGSRHVFRGGSYYYDYIHARCAFRYRFIVPGRWNVGFGFRVACAPHPSPGL